MKLRLSASPLMLVSFALAACGPAPESDGPRPERRGIMQPTGADVARATEQFHEVRDEFLPWYYRSRPVRASQLGIHTHDGAFPAMTRLGIQGRIDSLLVWLAELEEIPFSHLEGDDRFDYGTLEYALRAELLDLEETRTWARDPRIYTTLIASGIATLAERTGAPAEERVPDLRSRMAAAPRILEAARENLSGPPELWTRLAADQVDALIEFLEDDLAAVLEGRPDVAGVPLPESLRPDRDRLVSALREHRDWLLSDVMGRATGDVRLGRYLFERTLLYNEHIALNVDELDRINQRMIASYQEAAEQVAAEIDPARTPREILDSLSAVPPEPDAVLATAREMMTDLQDWVLRAGVVTVPDETLPVVRAMPPYRTEVASLDGPGAFEAGTAFYSLATAREGWDEERQREHLSLFNRSNLLGMTAHQTFPGLYVQRSHERRVESELRRVFTARSFTRGWAHYAEGMIVDEGFGDADPGLRLGLLRRALHRHARWDAALRLHAMATPMEEVVRRFMDIALLAEAPAREEVVRGTHDPLYLADALGRLQIIELREDYREWLGQRDETFSLVAFHDRLLELALPLPLAREALMPLPETERNRPSARRR